MTILNNNLTETQINNVFNYCIGGVATQYEKENAVIDFLNSENVTIEEIYHELELNGWEY
jgi:hypothetical protein